MAKARYTVLVPRNDELGNPLRVAEAAHHYIFHGPWRIDSAQVSHGHPNDALHIYADDLPENDSLTKQLATFVGELANVPMVPAAKEGKNVASWQLRNHQYRPGQAAEPSALEVGVEQTAEPTSESMGDSVTESPGVDPVVNGEIEPIAESGQAILDGGHEPVQESHSESLASP